jgi:nucleoporin GLE1
MSSSSPSPSRSGRRPSLDSPSRQLLDEWTQRRISLCQHQKLLDDATAEKAAQHRAALAIAARRHHQVYLSAVQTQELERLERENAERQRLLAEEEARDREWAKQAELKRLEAEAAKKSRDREEQEHEDERRRREAQEREDKRREEQKREEQRLETQRRDQERLEEEKRQQQKLDEEKRQQQQRDAAQREEPNGIAQSSSATPLSFTRDSGSVVTTLDEKEFNHQRFLDLHQALKAMRRSASLKRSGVKEYVKEQERDIRKKVNQISADKQANLLRRKEIVAILQQAKQRPEPVLDARDFIINPTQPFPPGSNTLVSAVFIYLLNFFIKKVISKFAEDVSATRSYNAAETVGIVCSAILSDPSLQVHNNSFTDILVAKYHKVCPVLWGIYGSKNTVKDRERIGWKRIEGEWISQQEHYDRMAGLGAGWASLTLRDFSRVKIKNPLPAWHYWAALACILNVPPEERTQTHFVVLKGLVEEYVPVFIKFYGQAACVVLQKALVEFPANGPKGPASEALKVLGKTVKQKYKLTL